MGGVQLQQQLQQQLLRKTPELIRLIFNCGSVNDVGSWLIGFLQKISKIEGQQHLCLHKWKFVLVVFFGALQRLQFMSANILDCLKMSGKAIVLVQTNRA